MITKITKSIFAALCLFANTARVCYRLFVLWDDLPNAHHIQTNHSQRSETHTISGLALQPSRTLNALQHTPLSFGKERLLFRYPAIETACM